VKFRAPFCTALAIGVFSFPALAENEREVDWPGFYAGLNAGIQVGNHKNKTGEFGYNADEQEWSYRQSGFNGGAYLGFNHRWDSILLGPELDLGYLKLSGNGAQPDSPNDDTVGSINSDFYTALRLRAGVEQNDWLFFATAGLMGVSTDARIADTCNVAPCGGSTVEAQNKSLNLGFTVGAGVEHKLHNKWSVKLEYLYFNLGGKTISGATNLDVAYDWNAKATGHIFRAGLAFHFGEPDSESPPPPPPVAAEPVVEKAVDNKEAELAKVADVKKTDEGLLVTLQGDVTFEAGKWELTGESKNILGKVADVLLKDPTQKLLVQGHTDNSGKASWNKTISERRANAVKNYLIEKGFAKDNITATGLGFERSISGNDTAEGRAKNRRVEIYIQNMGAAK